MIDMDIIKGVSFSEKYYIVRSKEGRVYTDEELKNLPDISHDHAHYKEWLIRKDSCKRLLQYLHKKGNSLNILEVGCGNGWLTSKLATATYGKVIGVDINEIELEQAKRVFNGVSNLTFIHSELRKLMPGIKFDIIVFAASIQYFSSLKDILYSAMQHIAPSGEIHIVDSNFYKKEEIEEAKKRTVDYYRKVGVSMAEHYFHHSLEDIPPFDYKILHNPFSWMAKLRGKSPFYWVIVKPKDK